MKFSLKNSLNNLYYFIIATILLVVSLFYYHSQKMLELNNSLSNSKQIISKSKDILLNTINIENSFRGYILSGDESFLEPFYKSKKEIATNLNFLKKLTKFNKIQQIYISELNDKIELKVLTIN